MFGSFPEGTTRTLMCRGQPVNQVGLQLNLGEVALVLSRKLVLVGFGVRNCIILSIRVPLEMMYGRFSFTSGRFKGL